MHPIQVQTRNWNKYSINNLRKLIEMAKKNIVLRNLIRNERKVDK